MVAISDRISEAIPTSWNDVSTSSSSLGQRTDIKIKPPSSISSSSNSPVHSKNSTLSALKKKMMTQSTIYKRHEARLARSYALQDDPRPAFLRVLSGLPGFRIIIPPYQSKNGKNSAELAEQNQEIPVIKVVPGVYSEETIFARHINDSGTAIGPTIAETNHDTNGYIRSSAQESILQAMLAVGFCSGTVEYIFAYCNNRRTKGLKSATSSSLSPFRNPNITVWTTMKTTTTFQQLPLLFFHKSAISDIAGSEIHAGNSSEIPKAVQDNTLLKSANKARPSTGAFSKVLSTAFPTSLLFGTKVFLDFSLENQHNKTELKHSNARPVTSSILSSAIAGGVVGATQVALLRLEPGQRQSHLSSLPIIHQQNFVSGYSMNLMGRNVVASILYFLIYDVVSSSSSLTPKASSTDPNTNSSCSAPLAVCSNIISERKTTLKVVAGGALAGVVHAAAMNCHLYGHYGSMIWWSRIMLPATSRAVPIHALVFYGYEKMKEGVEAAA